MSKKNNWSQEELTCKPLESYKEILLFLQNPPSWRSLCIELKPHSKYLIKNKDIVEDIDEISLENSQSFCHFDSDAEPVKRHDGKTLPKTLVCHDMANGYHDDSIIDGTGRHDAYTFYNWGGIDIFCYFSHHLITIPPLGWINVGHAHGVKVIGTVITEWAEGAAFWDSVLDSDVEWQNFASILVAIAKTLKFDGWLLNIENKIAKPETLLEFLRYLHTTLHQELIDPVLIWYDSVTNEGHLSWQNGLNEKNKDFFDACDGIFTNYSWRETDIKSSALLAAERLTDVYIGIDVWGRNFFGGGQFNTQEAIKLAHKYGCSLAIFAPAWTHEAMNDQHDLNEITISEDMDYYDRFLLRDRALWGSIWPYLNTKLPTMLPFQTSFCRGQGKKRRLYGEVLCPVPWYNLRHMQYQPNSSHGPHGYLLSTFENIINVSRHGYFKDKNGIIKYRESFQGHTLALDMEQSKKIEITAEDSLVVMNEEDVENTNTEEVNSEATQNHETDQEGSKTVESKMKKSFKHLFKIKSPKTTDEYEESGESKLDVKQNAHQSMIRVSVNLRLGEKKDKTRYMLTCVPGELECLELFLEDSFVGGSCLKVNPSDEISPEHRSIRIFHCDFYCEDSLVACVVTKNLPGYEDQSLNIMCHVTDATGRDIKVVFIGRSLPPASHVDQTASGVLNLYPLNLSLNQTFRELQKYLLLNEPGFYIPVENSYGWKVRYYEMKLPGCRVTSVDCRTGLHQGPVLLGHFGLCHKFENSDTNSID